MGQSIDKAFGIIHIEFVFLVSRVNKDHELSNGCVEFHQLNLLSDRFNGFVINFVKTTIIFRNDFFTCNQTVNTIKEFTTSSKPSSDQAIEASSGPMNIS